MNQEIRNLSFKFLDVADIIIPVIGDGVMFYEGNNSEQIPLLKYVVERFRNDNPDIIVPDSDRADLFILTCFSHKMGNKKAFSGAYKRYISEARAANRIHMDPIILDFLKTFKFPVIITTSCFDYIEEAINKELHANKYVKVSYNPKSQNSTPLNNSVYHIFGIAEDKFSEWVYDEDVLLDFLHNLHSSDFTCVNLCEYINRSKSSMMVLGCGLPDWLFRFLWYSIGYPEKTTGGYWLNGNVNLELQHFLKNISYSPISTINEFLSTATSIKRIELDKVTETETIEEYDFFISYAGEDEAIAKRLYDNLIALGHKVWYDRRGDSEIKPGDKYVEKFARGIKLSNRAITIITENYIKAVQNPNRGLCQETRLIKQKAEDYISENKGYSFCIPMLINGRTFNNRKLETSFVEMWAGYVTSIDGGLDVLFKETSMQITEESNPQLSANI